MTYDVDGHDLAGRLLDLAELAEEVPEARLGDDLVRGKDAHPVELGLGLLLRRQLAADDLVLLEATHAVEGANACGRACARGASERREDGACGGCSEGDRDVRARQRRQRGAARGETRRRRSSRGARRARNGAATGTATVANGVVHARRDEAGGRESHRGGCKNRVRRIQGVQARCTGRQRGAGAAGAKSAHQVHSRRPLSPRAGVRPAGGATDGTEVVCGRTLAVFDAFAGWPKTTEDCQRRPAVRVRLPAHGARVPRRPSWRNSPPPALPRHPQPESRLHRQTRSSWAADSPQGHCRLSSACASRSTRMPPRTGSSALSTPCQSPRRTSPVLGLASVFSAADAKQDQPHACRCTELTLTLLSQLRRRARPPRRLYPRPPHERRRRRSRAPQELRRPARRLSRRQCVHWGAQLASLGPPLTSPSTDTGPFVDSLFHYLEAPHDAAAPLPYGNSRAEVVPPMPIGPASSSAAAAARDRKRPRSPQPMSHPQHQQPYKQPRITPNPFLFPPAAGMGFPGAPGFNWPSPPPGAQAGPQKQPCRDYHCKSARPRQSLSVPAKY